MWRKRTLAWGVCVCWGFGEITKTLPELVPRLGKQQSLSCSVPYQASVALFPPFPSHLILLFEVESNLADENDNWRVTSATTK